MSTTDTAARARLAAACIRLDDDTVAQDDFGHLLAQYGRPGASRIWVEATRIVESESPFEPPTHRAPDCKGYCGESYIDEDCEPCQILESVRHPRCEPVPFECRCGTAIPADQTAAILDHVDDCTYWDGANR